MTKSADITKMALKEWSRVEQRKNINSGRIIFTLEASKSSLPRQN
jgi:hypothetical protein